MRTVKKVNFWILQAHSKRATSTTKIHVGIDNAIKIKPATKHLH